MEKNNIDGKQLREWLRENDLLMKISPAQADIIVKTINQAGYELEIDSNNRINQISIDQEGTHVIPVTIDDIVDLAAEINYESLLNQEEKMKDENIESVLTSVQNLKEYLQLKNQSILINQAFQQTIYAKNINDLLDKHKELENMEKTSHKTR